nr:hypothetical protein [Dyella sp. ASV24]
MICSSHARVLLAFEKAFVEAGERGARLAAAKAADLGLTVPYSDGANLVEVLPDGTARTVKPLDPVRIGNDPIESDMAPLSGAFEPRDFEV